MTPHHSLHHSTHTQHHCTAARTASGSGEHRTRPWVTQNTSNLAPITTHHTSHPNAEQPRTKPRTHNLLWWPILSLKLFSQSEAQTQDVLFQQIYCSTLSHSKEMYTGTTSARLHSRQHLKNLT